MSHSKFTKFTNLHKPLRLMTVVAMVFGMFAPLAQTTSSTFAAVSVVSATFSGGAGTVNHNGKLYAKQGATVTLTVNTTDAKCVRISGAFTAEQTNDSRTTWTFTTTAPADNGDKSVIVFAAQGNSGTNGFCNGPNVSTQASYQVDNMGPVVAPTLNPAPNGAGWNKGSTTLSWTATDSGSGVAGTQPFKTDTVTANGITTLTASAVDRLGNSSGNQSATVRIDTVAPEISATQTNAGWGQPTTVTFTCNDPATAGVQASGIVNCVADGTSPASSSKTVTGNGTVSGTASDAAGNIRTITVQVNNVDTVAPQLSGTPTTSPNSNGWYKDDVTIDWTATDSESGIETQPADTQITGEGEGLTSTTFVRDLAGNETTATSSPAVNIDRTAPNTGISGTSNEWVNGTVNVTLSPSDNRAGVASTTYSINGGPTSTGTSFTLDEQGTYEVSYFSTDRAGNVEAPKITTIQIDKTKPTIGHTFAPSTYTDGAWTNQDVTVTFICADQGGSGLKNCTAPITKITEGNGQQVTGTATDNAGNSTNNTATVSIDKTKPTITAKTDRAANDAGWYNDDVTVSYTANDALSGIAATPANDVLGQGANQSANATATDAAGNSNSAGVSGINVDKTAPVLTGSAPEGWHNDDVTVTWQASDALSGLAGAVPDPSTVTGEGENLSATASVADKAGNDKTTTITGIKIDRSKPTTTASVPPVPSNGWYTAGLQVTLTGSDNLSGATTYYKVNGGATQTYSAPFTVANEGTNTVTFWSVDGAGNVETVPAPLTLKVDSAAPSTTVILPPTPESGWYITSGLPVAFTAQDGANGSGIAATYYSIDTVDSGATKRYGEPFTQTLADGEHKITFWSVDIAGNMEAKETVTQTVSVNVDTTPPSISGATVTRNADGTTTPREPNSYKWFNSPVDVKFTCADGGSGLQTGVAGCAGDTTLANNGEGQTVRGDAVDVAGNTNFQVFGPVNIDQTKPTLSGAVSTTGRSAAGWYKDDATVTWTGVDTLSGIDPLSQPAPTKVTGEGGALVAGPVTINDKAGNTSDAAQVEGIKIDRTAPSISGATVNENGTPRAANADGWFNSAVRVRFTAEDKLSGIQDKPSDMVLDEDGADQSAKGSTTDLADNSSSATVSGINIDSKAPQTSANNKCDGSNGWCRGQTATVTLNAVDQGLSGVKEIHYVVNGGQAKVAAGASTEVLVPLAAKSGLATVEYWAVDKAGNAEAKGGVSLKYDNIAPTVTHAVNPAANANGWNTSDATVTFTAKDDDGGSGVDLASVTPAVMVTAETAGQLVTGTAKDLAGNTGTDSVTVKLDRTAPTITAAIKSGTLGANGWYTGPVTVGFTCSDTLSGIATCPADVVLNGDGKDQTASGTAVDKAGNEASAKVSGINIDSTKPVITVTGAKASYILGEVHGITCSATDTYKDASGATVAGSGVDGNGCKVIVTGGTANGVGGFTYTATAKDNAGNTTTTTGTYSVIYKWDGFLQPINDTAHQVSTSTSIFKAGSTVPAKFQLKRVDGTVVQASTAPAWLAPAKGSVTSAAVDESAYSDPATSGSTYTWNSTGLHYQFNYGTAKSQANYYWRIGTKLDDGQIYYVNLGLR